MKNKTSQNHLLKIIILSITAVVVLFLVLISLISLLNPNGLIGYRRLFVDSHTNTYKQSTDFEYGQFTFNITAKETAITPTLHDCSNLLEGGIFGANADAFFAKQTTPNYWPKEDCITANQTLTNDASKSKNLHIDYTVKNRSSDIAAINEDWITVLGDNGDILLVGGKDLTITPHGTVKNSIDSKIDNTSLGSLVVQLPNNATQIVSIK